MNYSQSKEIVMLQLQHLLPLSGFVTGEMIGKWFSYVERNEEHKFNNGIGGLPSISWLDWKNLLKLRLKGNRDETFNSLAIWMLLSQRFQTKIDFPFGSTAGIQPVQFRTWGTIFPIFVDF